MFNYLPFVINELKLFVSYYLALFGQVYLHISIYSVVQSFLSACLIFKHKDIHCILEQIIDLLDMSIFRNVLNRVIMWYFLLQRQCFVVVIKLCSI